MQAHGHSDCTTVPIDRIVECLSVTYFYMVILSFYIAGLNGLQTKFSLW